MLSLCLSLVSQFQASDFKQRFQQASPCDRVWLGLAVITGSHHFLPAAEAADEEGIRSVIASRPQALFRQMPGQPSVEAGGKFRQMFWDLQAQQRSRNIRKRTLGERSKLSIVWEGASVVSGSSEEL